MISAFEKTLETKGEVYLRIKVLPNSSKNDIKDIMDDGTLKISVKAKPQEGKANAELIKYLSNLFNVAKSNIFIINGKTSNLKLIKIIK